MSSAPDRMFGWTGSLVSPGAGCGRVESVEMISGRSWFKGLMWSRTDGWEDSGGVAFLAALDLPLLPKSEEMVKALPLSSFISRELDFLELILFTLPLTLLLEVVPWDTILVLMLPVSKAKDLRGMKEYASQLKSDEVATSTAAAV